MSGRYAPVYINGESPISGRIRWDRYSRNSGPTSNAACCTKVIPGASENSGLTNCHPGRSPRDAKLRQSFRIPWTIQRFSSRSLGRNSKSEVSCEHLENRVDVLIVIEDGNRKADVVAESTHRER